MKQAGQGRPPEKVTFELRPEGTEGGAMWVSGRKSVPGRGNGMCKVLRLEEAVRRAVWLEGSEPRVSGRR